MRKSICIFKTKGFKNIVQLEGGILNYLEYIKKSKRKLNGMEIVLCLMTEFPLIRIFRVENMFSAMGAEDL